MATFPVVLDANVLFGILPTDLLITTASYGLYRAHWTEEILAEAHRNVLAKQSQLDPNKVDARFDQMRTAVPEAMLEPPPTNILNAMTNDPGDRHVLATAVDVGAETIVTENKKHFLPADCSPHGVKALTLDEFVLDLVSLNPEAVGEAITEMATRRKAPPTSSTELRRILQSRYMPKAIPALETAQDQT